MVDGSEIETDNYTVDASGKPQLTTDFVNGLSGGEHTMVTTYSDGSTLTTVFEVTKTTSSNNQVTSTSGVVATGEEHREWMGQLALLFAVLSIATVIYRKRLFSNR